MLTCFIPGVTKIDYLIDMESAVFPTNIYISISDSCFCTNYFSGVCEMFLICIISSILI